MTNSTSGRSDRRQLSGTRFCLPIAAVALVLLPRSLAADSPDAPLPLPSHTEPRTIDAPSKPRILVISRIAEPEDADALQRSVAAQLADLPIEVFFFREDSSAETPTTVDPASAVPLMRAHAASMGFLIESTESDVSLHILEETPSGIEITHRRVDAARGTPQHEALAVIIRSTVSALIERVPLPPQKEAPKSSVTQKTPPKTPPPKRSEPKAQQPRRAHLFGEIGGALGWFASDPSPRGGMAVSLGVFPTPHFYIRMGYTAFSTIETKSYNLRLTLKRHPIYLSLGYFHRFKLLFIAAGVSLILDYAVNSVSSTNPDLILAADDGELTPYLAPHVLFGVRIRDRVRLFLKIAAEIPLRDVRYGIHTLQRDILLIDPLPVQPVVTGGLAVDFF